MEKDIDINELLKNLVLAQCELEADKYFLNIGTIRGVITKEDREAGMKEINEKLEKVENEIKRLSVC